MENTMTPTKQVTFALTTTTQLDASYDLEAAKAQAELARAAGASASLKPILPSGLTRKELDAIVAEIGIEYFRPTAEELINTLNVVRGDEQDEYAFECFNVIGGDRIYVVDGEEFSEVEDALDALGCTVLDDGKVLVQHDDGEYASGWGSVDAALKALAEDGEIEIAYSSEQLFPPMWNSLWATDWLPGGWQRDASDKAQEIADFTGVVIYEDTEGDKKYLIGVNGAGYDFYEAHWIPLAYLWGRYSS